MRLEVLVLERDHTFPLTTPDVTYQVLSYSQHAVGGPLQAEVEGRGDALALGSMVNRLGCPLRILDEKGRSVWWGYIGEARLRYDAVEVGWSVQGMVNRCAVAYTDSATGQRVTTAWSQDDESIALYGTYERLLLLANATVGQAEALRDRVLADLRYPTPVVTPQASPFERPQLMLTCYGYWSRLGNRYYSDTTGYERHEVDATGHVKVGQTGYIADTLGFEDTTEGDRVYDMAAGLGGFLAGDRIQIAGAHEPDNNGAKSVIGTISNTHLVLEEDLDNENPGYSVTITPLDGTKCAQSFGLSDATGWRLAAVQLRVQAAGAPSDSLQVQVCADSSGLPGTVLATASLAGSALPTEEIDWVTFAFDHSLTLTPGTPYWLVVSRTGSLTPFSGYAVGLDEEGGYPAGALYLYNGSWAARSPTSDLTFVVVGSRMTTDQVQAIIAASGEFAGIEVEDASSVYASPYRDGDTTGRAEVEALLRSGTAGERRLLATVTPERLVRVWEAPASGDPYALYADGRLTDALGRAVERHLCPVAFWLRVQDLPTTLDLSRLGDPTLSFAEESEFEVGSGHLQTMGYGNRSPWSLGQAVEG